MPAEVTFNIDNFGNNTIITDDRAYAIRIANLIANKHNGLPNNPNIGARIANYSMEEANDNTRISIEQEIRDQIASYLNMQANVSIEFIDADINGMINPTDNIRKICQVTVVLQSVSGDVTVVLNSSVSNNGLELNEITCV